MSYAATLSTAQSLTLSHTGVVTVTESPTTTYTRSPAWATMGTENSETIVGTELETTTYPGTGTGTYAVVAFASSVREAWGTGTATVHSDAYFPVTSGTRTETAIATMDKYGSDSHSSSWSWQKGVGGSASSTATNTRVANYLLVDVLGGPTVGAVYWQARTDTSQDASNTDERRTYTVPTTLPTAAYTNSMGWQTQVAATSSVTGSETSSTSFSSTATATNSASAVVGSGFGWHREYETQTFTLHTTEGVSVSYDTHWVTGTDTHTASYSNTASYSPSYAVGISEETQSHTFSEYKAEHRSYTATASTQDSIDSRDYRSLWISHSQSVSSGVESTWASDSHIFTSSLSEIGAGTDITSTLNTYDSFTMQAHGSVYSTAIDAWFKETINATDTNSETKTPIAGGATRTLDTSLHNSFNAFDNTYIPFGGGPRGTHSTTTANDLVTLQNVGTLREYLNGDYTDSLWFASNKWLSSSYYAAHTSGSLDQNGQWQGTLSTSSENFDSSQTLSDNGIDPDWIAFSLAFAQGIADVLLAGPSMLYMFLAHPCSPVEFAQQIGQFFLDSCVGLANTLVALVSGRDPETGEKLSSREYAELVGGLLGMIVGGEVLGFALDLAGTAFGIVARRMGAVVRGERCGIFRACFVAGTPLVTPDGSKAIEEFKSVEEHGNECDRILSRSEWDPDGPIVARQVLRKFVRVAPVVNLHVAGRIIGTTAEHPFYVEGKGWTPAKMIVLGERVLLKSGEWFRVDGVADSGRVETVYNLEVEADHTYFVGGDQWGFAVWAHNAECAIERVGGEYVLKNEKGQIVERSATREVLEQSAKARGWTEVQSSTPVSANPVRGVPPGTRDRGPHLGRQQGREGRPDQLETYEFDPNQPKHVRGWLQNERRRIAGSGGGPDYPRTPPGYVQAHGRTTPAREGFDYSNSRLQLGELNRLEESIRRRFGRL